MQLKLRRNQKTGMTGTPIFVLDVMAELTSEETALVAKYKLKNQLVYTSDVADQNLARARAGSWAGLGGAIMDRMIKRSFTPARIFAAIWRWPSNMMDLNKSSRSSPPDGYVGRLLF